MATSQQRQTEPEVAEHSRVPYVSSLRFSTMPLLELELLLRINVLPLLCVFHCGKSVVSPHLILSEAAAVFVECVFDHQRRETHWVVGTQ